MNFTKIKKIVQSGQPGTKKYIRIYGADLICVRYKYNYKKRERYKTIELIVDKKPWNPQKNDPFSCQKTFIRIRYGEDELGKKVRSSGGIWNRSKRLWMVPLQTVLDLNLEDRIVQ